jgi:histidinol dehydrogenase
MVPDSQVILVSTSKKLIDAVEEEVQIQLEALPRERNCRESNC